MNGSHLAVCIKTLPEKHGCLVRFRDGTAYLGEDDGIFVRVLAQRAHPTMGGSVSLPQPGELGMVVQVDEEVSVWMGSLHWQESNQADPEPGIEFSRHDSGVISQIRSNGDVQFDHPSGALLRMTETEPVLEYPINTSAPTSGMALSPWVEFWHPSEGNIVCDPSGNLLLQGFPTVKLIHPEGEVASSGEIEITETSDLKVTGFKTLHYAHKVAGTLDVDADGNLAISAFKSLNIQIEGGTIGINATGELSLTGFAKTLFEGATRRFVMANLLDWLKAHTHTGVHGPTSVPIQAGSCTADTYCTPDTFKGP